MCPLESVYPFFPLHSPKSWWFNNPTTTLSPFFFLTPKVNKQAHFPLLSTSGIISIAFHFRRFCMWLSFIPLSSLSSTALVIQFLSNFFFCFFNFNLFIIYTRFYLVSSTCIDFVVYVGSFCFFFMIKTTLISIEWIWVVLAFVELNTLEYDCIIMCL